MLRDFFLGIIKIHILYHADLNPVFGMGLMRELEHHGYKIGPGTLYPILHHLEKEQLLLSFNEKVNGKIRRYYRITRKGKIALEDAKKKSLELVKEILQ